MNPLPPTISLDLRGLVCPMNYVRTKLALEAMQSGEVLEVCVDEGEASDNVPRSARADAHRVLSIETDGASTRIRIEKA